MITRATITRFVLAMLVSVALVAYILISFLGLLNFLLGDYVVTMRLPETGGLFERGEVTYRGVAIGSVKTIRLVPGGVEADLNIDGARPPGSRPTCER